MPIEFVSELPAAGRTGRSTARDVAAELLNTPGVWAKIRTEVKRNPVDQNARAIRLAYLSAYKPAGAYEATVRKNDEGTFDLYARFVGDAS